jgi:hypothetical protein
MSVCELPTCSDGIVSVGSLTGRKQRIQLLLHAGSLTSRSAARATQVRTIANREREKEGLTSQTHCL